MLGDDHQSRLDGQFHGDDYMNGEAGNDQMEGGGGDDTMWGGTGNDVMFGDDATYLMKLGYGNDTIRDIDATDGNVDTALFGPNIGTDQLWFSQAGLNLEVSVIGTNDKFTVENWYMGDRYHVEQFKTSDGAMLLDSQVQNLVQAMASFSPPAAGQTTMPANYASSLAPVLAANWH